MDVKRQFIEATKLVRLTKQYGTLLLMLPALWSLYLAGQGEPRPWIVFIIVAGAFLMRSAGCVINDIADRNYDPFVDRTKNRPLAAGRITLKEAVTILLFLVFIAVSLAFLLNRLAILMCFIGLVLALIYPFMKRYINLPQVVLGVAFGWGAIVAWAAQTGKIELPAILILICTVFWVTAYDTIYALMDKDDDIKIGVKSSAIFFGKFTWQAAASLYMLTILTLISVGWLTNMGLFYYLSIVLVFILFAFQIYFVKNESDREVTFKTFASNVVVGFLVLLGIFGNYVRF
jgi:4-hydroxybenzoate polyprenyltransferase